MPLKRLTDEMTTLMLAKLNTSTQFKLEALCGTVEVARGLGLLKWVPDGSGAAGSDGVEIVAVPH